MEVDPEAGDERKWRSAVIEAAAFSDELDEARMMIEESERKIINLSDEQLQLKSSHVRSEDDDGSETGYWIPPTCFILAEIGRDLAG